jgi:hypothetical protein
LAHLFFRADASEECRDSALAIANPVDPATSATTATAVTTSTTSPSQL